MKIILFINTVSKPHVSHTTAYWNSPGQFYHSSTFKEKKEGRPQQHSNNHRGELTGPGTQR